MNFFSFSLNALRRHCRGLRPSRVSHTPGLAAEAPREPQITHWVLSAWPRAPVHCRYSLYCMFLPIVGLGAEKQCSCRGNKNLIYGSFLTKPFISSLLYYQNECKRPQFQQNEAPWLFLKCAFPSALWFCTRIQRTPETSQMTLCNFNGFFLNTE